MKAVQHGPVQRKSPAERAAEYRMCGQAGAVISLPIMGRCAPPTPHTSPQRPHPYYDHVQVRTVRCKACKWQSNLGLHVTREIYNKKSAFGYHKSVCHQERCSPKQLPAS